MGKVFISHTTADDIYGHLIVEHLEKHGIECFIDHRDIEGGVKWEKYMLNNVKESELMIVVVSRETCKAVSKRKYILDEIKTACENNKRIIPVIIGNITPCKSLMQYIGNRNFIITEKDKFYNYLDIILQVVESEKTMPKISTVFTYDSERGVMVNPKDGQRNVSFRTDTLTNMMGIIFEEVCKSTNYEKANEIFFKSGYDSGKKFCERNNGQWGVGNTIEDIKNRINKWCEFDSAVGWGKFSAEINLSEDLNSLSGTISIREAFLVDKMERRQVCSFVKGYCVGVLEAISQGKVELTCYKSCPINHFLKNTCEFEIKIKNKE